MPSPRLINRDASRIIRAKASVVAGQRYYPPTSDAIALDVVAKDGKYFRTLVDITIRYGSHDWLLRKGFRWNGADIPRVLGWLFALLGVTQYDPRVALASGFHDDVCNQANKGKVMRVIGDAIFVTLLMPISFNGKSLDGVGQVRAALMYAGVRAYSMWRWLGRIALWAVWGLTLFLACLVWAVYFGGMLQPIPAANPGRSVERNEISDGLHSVLVRPVK
jgi:hypothetical protein